LCQEKAAKDVRHPYKKKCYHAAYETREDELKAFVDNDIPLPLGVKWALESKNWVVHARLNTASDAAAGDTCIITFPAAQS